MPSQELMLAALDAALSAHVNQLFSKMASSASGPNPEGRFAEGIKNAAAFYDKAAEHHQERGPRNSSTTAPKGSIRSRNLNQSFACNLVDLCRERLHPRSDTLVRLEAPKRGVVESLKHFRWHH